MSSGKIRIEVRDGLIEPHDCLVGEKKVPQGETIKDKKNKKSVSKKIALFFGVLMLALVGLGVGLVAARESVRVKTIARMQKDIAEVLAIEAGVQEVLNGKTEDEDVAAIRPVLGSMKELKARVDRLHTNCDKVTSCSGFEKWGQLETAGEKLRNGAEDLELVLDALDGSSVKTDAYEALKGAHSREIAAMGADMGALYNEIAEFGREYPKDKELDEEELGQLQKRYGELSIKINQIEAKYAEIGTTELWGDDVESLLVFFEDLRELEEVCR